MEEVALVQVVESFVAGKADDPFLCEDAVVVSGDYAAVVDGATDSSGRRYGGVAGGRWAMLACVEAIGELSAGLDALAAVAAMTAALAARVAPELGPAIRPSASVAIFSPHRREVWQIGDVGFSYRGCPAEVGRPGKPIDHIAASFRAAVRAAADAAGETTVGSDDCGRAALRPLLERQGALRNTTGRFGYAGIDGRPVPPSLIVVHRLPDDVDEVVLASDGYPRILASLAASEALLARLLTDDPACEDALLGTKGVVPGSSSYDDRAYLRLRA